MSILFGLSVLAHRRVVGIDKGKIQVTRVPWGASRVMLILFYTIILRFFLEFSMLTVFPRVFLNNLTMLTLGELSLIAPLMVYLTKKRISLIFLGLDAEGVIPYSRFILIMLPLMLFTGVLSGVIVQTLIPIPKEFEKVFEVLIPISFTDLIFFSIATVLVVAPCEELLFRGFVQRGLESPLGGTGSIIASSIIFGLFHLNPWQFLPAFTLGLILGYAFKKKDYRIWIPIALHASYNVTLLVLSYFFTA
ncbi:MAG: CPBP family intramembrane metalloprotease [Candidatus Brockarchaeota archaeon]|nr:CPBP family intramembrane metalloprotease [Candidatus Brockarchaeota archaeon]